MSTDCWGAFGSDSESDGDEDKPEANAENDLETIADAVSLAATQYFAQLMKSSGTSLGDRLLVTMSNLTSEWGEIMISKLSDRGVSAISVSDERTLDANSLFDAAVIFHQTDKTNDNPLLSCQIRKSVLPGGMMWIVSSVDYNTIEQLSDDIWDVRSAVITNLSPYYTISRIQKRACLINSWSCTWMDKHSIIPEHIAKNKSVDLNIQTNETYLQYEQRVASDLTICPSVAERTGKKVTHVDTNNTYHVTLLTTAHVEKAVSILRQHGFLIIKGLLPPEQTLRWGEAVLVDFQNAVDRLKHHPIRPVNLLDPHQIHDNENVKRTTRVFEPLSYKEMAMREDLRVDLRAGPTLKKVAQGLPKDVSMFPNNNDGPITIDAETIGTPLHWRFNPSIIAIIKALFNPKHDNLSIGNFGRWNFGGNGPDGTPQPFRIGPIGSVISCPGSGDQAIHADTPHLFEHLDCLPCHYCNIFTPGFTTSCDEQDSGFFKHEFDHDGAWTGNTTMGGTALVNRSHKLSVTAELLADEGDNDSLESLVRKQLLQLQTIRPALDEGDVLIFDNRTLHYGLANNSNGDKTGVNVNAGRRPMLYLNVTQSWFHDPKNWDDRESIFD